eukprot:g2503.t1
MKKAMDRFMRLGVSIRWLVEWTNEKKCWTYKTRKVIKDIVRKETNKSKKEYLNTDAMRINRENGQWDGESDLFKYHYFMSIIERCAISFVVWSSDTSKGPNTVGSSLGDLSCLVQIYMARLAGIPVFVRAGNASRDIFRDDADGGATSLKTKPMAFRSSPYTKQAGFSVLVDVSTAQSETNTERDRLWKTIESVSRSVHDDTAVAHEKNGDVASSKSTTHEEKSTPAYAARRVRIFNRAINASIRSGLKHSDWSELLAAACGRFEALKLGEEGRQQRRRHLSDMKDNKSTDNCKSRTPSYSNNAARALHAAAESGVRNVIRYILSRGDVSVDARHPECGRTPLLLAATFDHARAVSVLLDCGANPDVRGTNGESALMWASSCDYTGVVRVLLSGGTCGRPANINLSDNDGFTAIFGAAGANHLDSVNLLLDAGSDINATNTDGFTPLMYASSLGHTEIVKQLMRRGADAKMQANDGATALIFAATRGFVDTIRALIPASDIDETTSGDDPLSAISTAAYGGHVNAVVALMEGGASLENPLDDSAMPLMAAASAGYGDVVQVLLDKDPKSVNTVESQARGGRSALLKAAAAGHVEVVKILLECGADPFAVDRHNRTPLNLARRNEHEEIYRLLLKAMSAVDLPRKQSRASGQWASVHAEREAERKRERQRRSAASRHSARFSNASATNDGGCNVACTGAGCAVM